MRFPNNMSCPLPSARASRALRHSRSQPNGRESHDLLWRAVGPERCSAWRVFVANLSGLPWRVELESESATTLDLKRRISAPFSIPSVEFDVIASGARRMKPRDKVWQYLVLCLDVFYCDRTCADAGFAKHGPDCSPMIGTSRAEREAFGRGARASP